MKWMRDLMVGDSVRRFRRRIQRRIRAHKMTPGVYVLLLPANPDNQLEILRADLLLQPFYRKREDLTIVGLAGNYEEAVFLVMRLADACAKKTGGGDIRSFLLNRPASQMRDK